jgi:hypothetical protein
MKTTRSWLTLGVIPTLILGAMVLPFALNWSDLPNPMASHWDLAGNPNGSMPPIVLLAVIAGIFLAMWWAVGRTLHRTPEEAPSFIAGLFFVGELLAGITWFSVISNRGLETWEAADGIGLLQILVVVTAAAAAGYVGWLLAGGSTKVDRTATRPIIDISEPTNAVWSGRGSGRLAQPVGVIVIIVGLALWGWTTLVLLFVGLVVLAFAEVRVTVSNRGAVISLGWLGVPSWTVPLSAITQAEIETVTPMSYGGWGYRIRPGVRAVVIRGGEALRLVREGKADIVITVDDAQTAAGLINSMLGVDSGA